MDDRGSSTPAYRPPRPPRPPPPRAPGPSLPVEAQPRSPPPARARGFECPGGERPRRYPRGRPGGGRFVSRRRLRPLPRMRLARAPGTRSRRAARSETASCRRGTPSPARTQRADGDRRWTAAAGGFGSPRVLGDGEAGGSIPGGGGGRGGRLERRRREGPPPGLLLPRGRRLLFPRSRLRRSFALFPCVRSFAHPPGRIVPRAPPRRRATRPRPVPFRQLHLLRALRAYDVVLSRGLRVRV